jgi:predicted GNAT family acetyltransferase
MKPVDDKPVWSVVCFVVPPEHRGQGVAHALLRGAIAYAAQARRAAHRGVSGRQESRSSDASMWFGAKSMYDRAGFKEVRAAQAGASRRPAEGEKRDGKDGHDRKADRNRHDGRIQRARLVHRFAMINRVKQPELKALDRCPRISVAR